MPPVTHDSLHAHAAAVRRLLDEHAIHDLVARFDDAVLRGDEDAFRACWAEDGRWEIGQYNPADAPDVPPFAARGVDEMLRVMRLAAGMNDFFFRSSMRSVIAFGPGDPPDAATARTPTTELARRKDGTGYSNVAVYDDVLVRRDGGWRFAVRRYDYLWVDNHTRIPGSAVPLPPGLVWRAPAASAATNGTPAAARPELA